MKAKKNQLERIVQLTKKNYLSIKHFKPLQQLENETNFTYLLAIIFYFITRLDKILGFYYNRFQLFRLINGFRKEIITLTKEIKKYEHKL
jgi:hypothetical protein